MWSNRNKINSGQSKTLAIEGLREGDGFYKFCKFMIKYWIDFAQFLFLLCTLSFLKLMYIPQSPQKVLLSVAAAVLRPSYLLHISYLHIPPPPSRDISTKRFPTTNLLFVNQPLLNFSVGAKIPLISSKRALPNLTFQKQSQYPPQHAN